MAYNSAKKLQGNIDALRLAFSKQENYSDEEVKVLQSYAGFGGLKGVLFGAGTKEDWIAQNASANDLRLYPAFIQLHELLREQLSADDYKSALDTLKRSILTELRIELRRLESEIAAKVRETQTKVVPADEADEHAEQTAKETLDHSENLLPLRNPSLMGIN